MTGDVEKTEFYFFATSSINITHFLIAFLYMNSEEVSYLHRKVRAERRHFKHFCILNAKRKGTFFELNALALIFLYKRWCNPRYNP